MKTRRRRRPDFKGQKRRDNQWYDMEYDAVLIEQSIAKQYGILPSQQGELKYADWAKLVGGLMNDTPLGQIVSIRSERDKDILKHMTPEQKELRAEWSRFQANRMRSRPEDEQKAQMRALEQMIAAMFGR